MRTVVIVTVIVIAAVWEVGRVVEGVLPQCVAVSVNAIDLIMSSWIDTQWEVHWTVVLVFVVVVVVAYGLYGCGCDCGYSCCRCNGPDRLENTWV